LHRIVKFIAAGGMDVVRAKELAELECKRRELEAARTAADVADRRTGYQYQGGTRENAITMALGSILGSFFD
jgi:hypothetical protein